MGFSTMKKTRPGMGSRAWIRWEQEPGINEEVNRWILETFWQNELKGKGDKVPAATCGVFFSALFWFQCSKSNSCSKSHKEKNHPLNCNFQVYELQCLRFDSMCLASQHGTMWLWSQWSNELLQSMWLPWAGQLLGIEESHKGEGRPCCTNKYVGAASNLKRHLVPALQGRHC